MTEERNYTTRLMLFEKAAAEARKTGCTRFHIDGVWMFMTTQGEMADLIERLLEVGDE